jgi:hypothetical protein
MFTGPCRAGMHAVGSGSGVKAAGMMEATRSSRACKIWAGRRRRAHDKATSRKRSAAVLLAASPAQTSGCALLECGCKLGACPVMVRPASRGDKAGRRVYPVAAGGTPGARSARMLKCPALTTSCASAGRLLKVRAAPNALRPLRTSLAVSIASFYDCRRSDAAIGVRWTGETGCRL